MDSNPHATPADTLAALRARCDAQIEKAVLLALRWEGYRDNEQESDEVRAAWDLALIEGDAVLKGAVRDARLKLALLDQVERWIVPDEHRGVQWEYASAATTILRLLAESAGEAVAW